MWLEAESFFAQRPRSITNVGCDNMDPLAIVSAVETCYK